MNDIIYDISASSWSIQAVAVFATVYIARVINNTKLGQLSQRHCATVKYCQRLHIFFTITDTS